MDDLNEYLKNNFDRLQLSHQNFVVASDDKSYKGVRKSGDKINSRYRLNDLNFDSFYKPISNYLK